MKRLLLVMVVALVVTTGNQAVAQIAELPFLRSFEVLRQGFACPFECKSERNRYRRDRGDDDDGDDDDDDEGRSRSWQEVTTLMLARPVEVFDRSYIMVMLDGQQNVATTRAGDPLYFVDNLGPKDLDEINVCRSLKVNAGRAPQAGFVVIGLGASPNAPPPGGGEQSSTRVWYKNVIGSFRKNQNEPFSGKVTGIGKGNCDRVSPATIDSLLAETANDPNAAVGRLILIENTEDQTD